MREVAVIFGAIVAALVWFWDPAAQPAHVDAPLASGRIVYAHESTGQILSVLANGADAHVLTASSGAPNATPSPSPDGRVVAFSLRDAAGRGDLALVNADGTGLTVLTSTPDVDERAPAFAHSGRSIYFARDVAPGRYEIFAFDLRTRTQTRLTNVDKGVVGRPAASPDGQFIAFEAHGAAIYVTSADGKRVHCLSTALDEATGAAGARDAGPAFSPDSAWLAFASTRSGASEIWVSRRDGAEARRVTELGDCHAPSWSPDGSAICFERAGEVWVVRVDGTRAARVVAAARAAYPQWAPDPGVTLPLVRGIAEASVPEGHFRLKITGESFQPGLQVYVGDDPDAIGGVRFKGPNAVVVSGDAALEARFARGVETQVRVVNPDGGEVTATFLR